MRKVTSILILSMLFFSLEYFLFNYVSSWFVPNLLLLLIIFVNLWLGIRYGLLVSIFSGLLKDSFSTDFFGLHIFTFVACTYATVFLMRYMYQKGSMASRFLLVASMVTIHYTLQFFLHLGMADVSSSFLLIFVPEFILTLIFMEFVFSNLRLCASRFFV